MLKEEFYNMAMAYHEAQTSEAPTDCSLMWFAIQLRYAGLDTDEDRQLAEEGITQAANEVE